MNIVLFRTVVFEISSFMGSTVPLGLSKDKRYLIVIYGNPEAEFKEFESRLKFKQRLKYGWFHLKLYLIFQDAGAQLKPVFGGFETRLKFIKFGHRLL